MHSFPPVSVAETIAAIRVRDTTTQPGEGIRYSPDSHSADTARATLCDAYGIYPQRVSGDELYQTFVSQHGASGSDLGCEREKELLCGEWRLIEVPISTICERVGFIAGDEHQIAAYAQRLLSGERSYPPIPIWF